jgi:hypothetical protein
METRQTKQTISTMETSRKESNPPSAEQARERNRGFNGEPKHQLQSIKPERRRRREFFVRQRNELARERERERERERRESFKQKELRVREIVRSD